MPTKIKTQNLLSGVISDAIPSSGDFTVTLSQAPTYTKGFIVFDVTSASSYESVYFHNRVGNVIYVKAENRPNPKAHSIGTSFQMNNTAELINYLSDNTDTFGYVEKTGGLTVNVWGGYVLTETGRVLVNDTSLTLPASQTNYIYITASNTIASTLNLSEANTGVPLATVITGSTSVSTITQEKPYITQKRGPQGEQGPAGVGIPTGGTTGQLLQKASGTDYDTEWHTLSGVGDMVKATYDPTNKNQDIFDYTYSKAEANSLLSAKQDSIGYIPANDTAVVKLTGSQSISGTKTFSDIITSLLRLTGGTPGVGKVLTSDASGNATWQTPSGVGDMVKATYDPTNKNQDIFAYPYSKSETNSLLSAKQDNIGYTPANDTAVVKLTGSQSISGTKTFSDIITSLFRLTGGTPGVGKVLTSDASGNATWQTIGNFQGCLCTASTVTISGSAGKIAFSSEVYDDNNFHDNVTNNSRLTVNSPGRYRINVNVIKASGSGQLAVSIKKNNTTYLARERTYGLVSEGTNLSVDEVCVATDYFEIEAYSDASISSVDVRFSITKI